MTLSSAPGPIGVFDSGFGGLTILRELVQTLPEYDYLYLGDNARAPYGTRSFETVYRFTLECVQYLFDQGCQLVVLACNTASAKALRTIQQYDLPAIDPDRRVLGVIRPSAEAIGRVSLSNRIGVLATSGTVKSESYLLEIAKLYPQIQVFQEACPMWVPLVENGEYNSPGADYFVKRHVDALMRQCADIDTVILGCTHYPLLAEKIRQYLPSHVTLLSQGQLVADSLADYLERHPGMDSRLTRQGSLTFLTTDSTDLFNQPASRFFGRPVSAQFVTLS
ncbi:glutamate racemase [Fluviicoccus keumensis]|uniref:Glutamate racemase n=1 Tax=Fluviicoccus keumensis TaxID=1435465 RepID=A0A4V2G5K4_9GAMM|nr:glutamate racemase [Fluviicoccus keumensis]RZU45156.1 glutamate racemase [Fluviicoccus keumensis]